MSIASFLRGVTHLIEEAGVPYMLTGSLAAAYYATPRSTQDVDAIVDTDEEGIERLVQGLLDAGLYVDRDAAVSAWLTRSQFNAIDPESGWKVDLIIRKDRPFSRTEFERRERAELLGVEVSTGEPRGRCDRQARVGAHRGLRHTTRGRGCSIATGIDWTAGMSRSWVGDLGLEAEWESVLGSLNPLR